MNCKKGDIAVVKSSVAGNCGKVVTCLEYLGNINVVIYRNRLVFLEQGDWWVVDRKLNMLLGGEVLMENALPFCADKCLMPIGNQDAKVRNREQEKELS